jgi:hypothetical protein
MMLNQCKAFKQQFGTLNVPPPQQLPAHMIHYRPLCQWAENVRKKYASKEGLAEYLVDDLNDIDFVFDTSKGPAALLQVMVPNPLMPMIHPPPPPPQQLYHSKPTAEQEKVRGFLLNYSSSFSL